MANRRSLNQNSFFHGPFLNAFQRVLADAGIHWSPEQCKWVMKQHLKSALTLEDFVKGSTDPITLPSGRVLRAPFSTKNLTTTGIEKFMEAGRAFAATECDGAQLPFPNEYINPQQSKSV